MGKNEKFSKKDLDAAWKKAYESKDEFQGGGEVYEDGRYRVALVDADRNESKSSGRDQVMFAFMFLEGDYKGKTVRDYNGLDRAESIPYLMRKILDMGFEAPEDTDGLEVLLKKMVKEQPKLKIQLKTNGEYQNVYVNNVLSEEEAGELEIPEDTGRAPAKEKVTKERGEEPAPAGGDEEEVKVGTRVRVLEDDEKDEMGVGEITVLDEENSEVTVKLDTGKKVIVGPNQLRLLPKEAPAKPKGKLTLKK